MSQTSSRPTPPLADLQYAGAQLERAALERDDAEGIAEALADPAALLVPVWRDRNLVVRDAAPAAGTVATDAAALADEIVFLGRSGHRAVFAADFSSLDEGRVAALADGEFVDLRRVGPVLSAADAQLMAYARGMLYWHRNHRHCGRCGAATEARRGGHLRACSDADCARPAFPRTDPAMIVLVLHPERQQCLLGRARGFPERAYSTLAGFVEPGESLEATVRREVHEEAGVRVGEVRYMGSQPWPFPSSLMVGFHAVAETTEIRRRDDELADARWFTPAELREGGEWGSDAELCLPRGDSIARALIDCWLSAAR